MEIVLRRTKDFIQKFIENELKENQVSRVIISYSELSKLAGCSKRNIIYTVKKLVNQGLLGKEISSLRVNAFFIPQDSEINSLSDSEITSPPQYAIFYSSHYKYKPFKISNLRPISLGKTTTSEIVSSSEINASSEINISPGESEFPFPTSEKQDNSNKINNLDEKTNDFSSPPIPPPIKVEKEFNKNFPYKKFLLNSFSTSLKPKKLKKSRKRFSEKEIAKAKGEFPSSRQAGSDSAVVCVVASLDDVNSPPLSNKIPSNKGKKTIVGPGATSLEIEGGQCEGMYDYGLDKKIECGATSLEIEGKIKERLLEEESDKGKVGLTIRNKDNSISMKKLVKSISRKVVKKVNAKLVKTSEMLVKTVSEMIVKTVSEMIVKTVSEMIVKTVSEMIVKTVSEMLLKLSETLVKQTSEMLVKQTSEMLVKQTSEMLVKEIKELGIKNLEPENKNKPINGNGEPINGNGNHKKFHQPYNYKKTLEDSCPWMFDEQYLEKVGPPDPETQEKIRKFLNS